MNSRKVLLALSLIFVIASGYGQLTEETGLLMKGAAPEKLAGDFSFTEGPAADSEGNVYFTDQPNDRIMKWSTDGMLTTFMQPSGRSNGMFFDPAGNLWSCADEKNEIWIIDKKKNVRIYNGKYDGLPFNGPNDLWIAPGGGVYFTDPYYQRPWWKHSEKPQAAERVYYLAPGLEKVVAVIGDLKQPNGIIGTRDGKTLYVADIGAGITWSYSINDDGTLSNKTLFCNLGSDGMTMDEKGNVYLTGDGVTVFDRVGNKIINIKIPERWTANVCFGGKDRKELFITATTGLYRIKMNVRGAY